MKRFNGSQSVGEIVAAFPGAARVFMDFGIDFCCGGGRLLTDAAREKGLDTADILESLEEACGGAKTEDRTGTDFRTLSSADLIDHIESVHHAYLKNALPEISELTARILDVHGNRHGELQKVYKLFHLLRTDLEEHLSKEENLLFPLIKEYEAHPSEASLEKVQRVVGELEDEHESAGGILKELERITDSFRVPSDACRSYALTYTMLQETEADLFQHIHLENNILFRRVAARVACESCM